MSSLDDYDGEWPTQWWISALAPIPGGLFLTGWLVALIPLAPLLTIAFVALFWSLVGQAYWFIEIRPANTPSKPKPESKPKPGRPDYKLIAQLERETGIGR